MGLNKGWGKLPLSNNLLIDDEKQKKIDIAKHIDDANEMELWAASAYVIDTNPVLFYRATHVVDEGMSERSLLMKAKQWVNSPRITQIVNYAKSSMLASDYVTPSMRRVLEGENKEKTKTLINKDNLEFEDAISLIESFLKRSDIDTADFKDVKGALDMLAKFKGWLCAMITYGRCLKEIQAIFMTALQNLWQHCRLDARDLIECFCLSFK